MLLNELNLVISLLKKMSLFFIDIENLAVVKYDFALSNFIIQVTFIPISLACETFQFLWLSLSLLTFNHLDRNCKC